MTDVAATPQSIRVTSVGIQGPPGPPGAGFTARQGNISWLAPVAGTYILVASQRYAYSFDGVFGLRVKTGSLTFSLLLNGVPIPGLENLALSTTPDDFLADDPVNLGVGDELSMTIDNLVAATELAGTVGNDF